MIDLKKNRGYDKMFVTTPLFSSKIIRIHGSDLHRSYIQFFSPAGVSGEPNTNCERSFQLKGYSILCNRSSITGVVMLQVCAQSFIN